jgi:hypothetical protein
MMVPVATGDPREKTLACAQCTVRERLRAVEAQRSSPSPGFL